MIRLYLIHKILFDNMQMRMWALRAELKKESVDGCFFCNKDTKHDALLLSCAICGRPPLEIFGCPVVVSDDLEKNTAIVFCGFDDLGKPRVTKFIHVGAGLVK